MADREPRVFIGVDGGASKTRVVALDAAGQLLGTANGAAATLNGRADTSWATILETIRAIETLAGLDLADASVVVGIAGTEIAPAYRAFLAAAPACGALKVVSDAHIACAGAHDGGNGAIVSVGTGVVGFCRDGETTARAGGWGFPHDDRGSGAWLGMEAVGHALAAADGRRMRDALAERLLADFNNDPGALAGWACSAHAGDFAGYARAVVELAGHGEASANALLDTAGQHVSAVARALIGDHADLALALTGGLAETIAPRLDADLQARSIPAVHDGAHGAALMARQSFMTSPETGS
ncbi:BadF/BadG/BcrA/BcrD ATPase family protein [Salinisphaera hydrothermalis]|uniref:ATPase, BadF/BadG/BcrA/BcrD type n=1 Tax=Salinisphaera hydrothermalis (strain C41B8) TaxID=1304275 RepID=A0A084IL75_SALHC|nr:BadF/BadG/BcrA/BcrD ATPase family protein [Salinisphaera hydrothermalis]KEZ77459.1 ATPase, BadF/BadG/BcrA/BcrD type [Salinisphaera hydrothermalis C41B8]